MHLLMCFAISSLHVHRKGYRYFWHHRYIGDTNFCDKVTFSGFLPIQYIHHVSIIHATTKMAG